MIYEPNSGTSITNAVKEAQLQAQERGREIVMRFNGILIHVQPTSHEYDIEQIYWLKHKIRRLEAGYKD